MIVAFTNVVEIGRASTCKDLVCLVWSPTVVESGNAVVGYGKDW